VCPPGEWLPPAWTLTGVWAACFPTGSGYSKKERLTCKCPSPSHLPSGRLSHYQRKLDHSPYIFFFRGTGVCAQGLVVPRQALHQLSRWASHHNILEKEFSA
jgi:hypothetical protein